MQYDTRKIKLEIEEKKDELVKLLKDYSRSQVAFWHQVPTLAKQLHRLNNFATGRFQMAGECYLWPISSRFLHGLQVDLRTGEIRFGGSDGSLEDVNLGQISLILKQLDAVEVIKWLEDEIGILSAMKSSGHHHEV